LTQRDAGRERRRAPHRAPAPHADAPPDARGLEPASGARWPEADRRVLPDRRLAPTPFWSAFLGLRRRRHGRRAGERDGIYVDRFARRDVALVVAILVLNIFDAFFTLIWLQRGGAEGNPVMAWVLEQGDGLFLVQKCFVVSIWLLLLVVHKNFRAARLGLWSLAAIYSLLILYHFALIGSGVDPRHGPGHGTAVASEEPGQQRGHRGLDPQRALPEAQGPQARRPEPLDLVVAPAALGPDGE
jgi:hypothetical protein